MRAKGRLKRKFALAEPAAHLGFAARAAHFVLKAFALAGEFGNRLDQAFVDVALRHLLPRNTDQIFDVCYRHGGFRSFLAIKWSGFLPSVMPRCVAEMNFPPIVREQILSTFLIQRKNRYF
jgi:hypothetical protein